MRPGRTIAYRFELLETAGIGGMGEVFRARDKTTAEIVAVKVRRAPEHAIERFEREATILAALSHPAIVRYITRGTTPDGDAYLVMEWLDHETLADRLASGLTVAESVAIARRIADALAAAHAAGVVHRDVKPDNVLVPAGDLARVKLADFGIARPMTPLEALTKSGYTLGTPGYMAPEQVRGESDVDGRVDVFALGCVLYECLAGKRAFSGSSSLATMIKILHAEPAPLADACPEVPAAVVALVDRMLDKDVARRPESMREVVAALSTLAALPDRERRPIDAAGRPTRVRGPYCVVLITATNGASAASRRAAVDVAAAKYDARVDAMLDGSLVATIPAREAPVVRATRAVRLALDVHRALPDVMIAVTCADPSGRIESDPADTAATRLSQVAFGAALGTRVAAAGVYVDDVAAALVRDAFVVERGEGGAIVRGERV